jgi:tRNA A37 threonylcarbamoyladenosine biosynthesis protein TsaE
MEEIAPLNLEHVFANCVSLIEWPIRLPNTVNLPMERLELDIRIIVPEQGQFLNVNNTKEDSFDDQNARYLTLTPRGKRMVQKIQKVLEEGYFEDLLLVNDKTSPRKEY